MALCVLNRQINILEEAIDLQHVQSLSSVYARNQFINSAGAEITVMRSQIEIRSHVKHTRTRMT